MPFKTTNVPPVLNSKIAVEFAGQLLLQAGADDTATSTSCEIGVNRLSPIHNLMVILVVQKQGRPATVISLLKGPLTDEFLIRLDPDPGAGDFVVFAPTPEPFVRTAAANNNELDSRWSLNLRSLHPNANRTFGAEPIIRLKTGVLYTPDLTDDSLDPKLTRPGTPDIHLFRVSADLAASIVPPANTSVLLQWSDLGDVRRLFLPRPGDDPLTTTYTVSFLNDPGNFNPNFADNELAHYYKVLKNPVQPIPGNERFTLEYTTSPIRTDEIPCLPAVLNGSS